MSLSGSSKSGRLIANGTLLTKGRPIRTDSLEVSVTSAVSGKPIFPPTPRRESSRLPGTRPNPLFVRCVPFTLDTARSLDSVNRRPVLQNGRNSKRQVPNFLKTYPPRGVDMSPQNDVQKTSLAASHPGTIKAARDTTPLRTGTPAATSVPIPYGSIACKTINHSRASSGSRIGASVRNRSPPPSGRTLTMRSQSASVTLSSPRTPTLSSIGGRSAFSEKGETLATRRRQNVSQRRRACSEERDAEETLLRAACMRNSDKFHLLCRRQHRESDFLAFVSGRSGYQLGVPVSELSCASLLDQVSTHSSSFSRRSARDAPMYRSTEVTPRYSKSTVIGTPHGMIRMSPERVPRDRPQKQPPISMLLGRSRTPNSLGVRAPQPWRPEAVKQPPPLVERKSVSKEKVDNLVESNKFSFRAGQLPEKLAPVRKMTPIRVAPHIAVVH